MKTLETERLIMDKKHWNEQLKYLQAIIRKDERIKDAKELAIRLHRMLYASRMSGIGETTFEDDLWDGLTDSSIRTMTNEKGRTIAYGIWHSTRIEDITMNLLVAENDQLFESGNWNRYIKSPVKHTGNSLSKEEILSMSSLLDIEALKEYRIAVGATSEKIISNLTSGDMKRKILRDNLTRIIREGAVDDVPSANWLIDFWSKKDIAGIILMPCLRHQLVHLNEGFKAKSKIKI